MSHFCTSYNLDARGFKKYADFDILFMFNPFEDNIYEEVVAAIKSQLLKSDTSRLRFLICYGGANIKAVNESGIFSLIREERCPYRGNLFRVYRTKNDV